MICPRMNPSCILDAFVFHRFWLLNKQKVILTLAHGPFSFITQWQLSSAASGHINWAVNVYKKQDKRMWVEITVNLAGGLRVSALCLLGLWFSCDSKKFDIIYTWQSPSRFKPGTHYPHVTWAHIKLTFYLQLLPYPFPCVGSHMLISIIWRLGVI